MDDENRQNLTVRVVAAVVEKDGRYLITRRRPTAVLPDLWEFPGGRVEEDEDDVSALRREFAERLDARIEVGSLISYVRHPYETYCVDLFLYHCILDDVHLTCKGVQEFRWVTSSQFDDYEFTPADEESMTRLLES